LVVIQQHYVATLEVRHYAVYLCQKPWWPNLILPEVAHAGEHDR
jgi:hypothetical protein